MYKVIIQIKLRQIFFVRLFSYVLYIFYKFFLRTLQTPFAKHH